MNCRPGCGACCIAPSISTALPGHPHGKPAGERCAQLDEKARCRLFARPERPAVCASLRPEPTMCGGTRDQAMLWLGWMEQETAPSP